MSVRKYKKGDIIIVKTNGSDDLEFHTAEILWIGRVKNLYNHNKVYGIQYLDEREGGGDGIYDGRRYFRGETNKCDFIKYAHILSLRSEESQQSQQTPTFIVDPSHYVAACVSHAAQIYVDASTDEYKDPIDNLQPTACIPIPIISTRWSSTTSLFLPTQREIRRHYVRHHIGDGASTNEKALNELMKRLKKLNFPYKHNC
eukprot:407421_1